LNALFVVPASTTIHYTLTGALSWVVSL